MENNQIKIAFVDAGEHLPLNLTFLSRRLNVLQKSIHFDAARTLSTEKIGNPQKEQWYNYKTLLDILETEERLDEYDFIIGITRFPITDYSETDLTEKDYFSKSDLKRISIISISPQILKYKAPDNDIYQYVTYICLCELLINMCKKDISHSAQKYCLFDECDNRIEIQKCISSAYICNDCSNKLLKEIDPKLLPEINKILKWCKRYRWRTAAKNTPFSPVFTLIFGVFLGWLIQIKFPKTNIIVGLGVILIYILIFIYYRFQHFQRTKR